MNPRLGLVLLCSLYGLGLIVDLYASGMPPVVKLAVLLLGLLASFLVYYSQFYQPTLRIQDDHLRLLLSDLFDALARKYREQQPGAYDLRINVMRVRRRYLARGVERRWIVGSRILRLDFMLGDYTDAEREQEYPAGVGCAGVALARNRPVVFDAIDAQEPRLALSATQREVTAHVSSILSIPIYRPGGQATQTPITVLNLDSRSPIAATGFWDDTPQALATSYAALIGAALP